MTEQEKKRVITFLEKKMCGPCRRDGAVVEHEGCVEAQELIEIVQDSS